jgi:plastocyanin
VSLQEADRPASRSVSRVLAPAFLAGLLALAGCGSSSSSSSSTAAPATTAATSTTSGTSAPATSAAQVLKLEANPEGQLKYNTTSLTAKAGTVAIAFTNMAPLSHNVTVESSSKQIVGATPTFQGATKALTLSLKPGTYKFFCSVPGHRMAGMEGTLTVN